MNEQKAPPDDSEHRLRAVRREKLEALRKQGIEPYPLRFAVTHSITNVIKLAQAELSESGAPPDQSVSVAGRITAQRRMGKLAFLDITSNGDTLQIQIREDLCADAMEMLKFLDISDFIGVNGKLFISKTGALTLAVHQLSILAKALTPAPDKRGGIKSSEVRRRQRYLDMLSNRDAIKLARKRAEIVSAIRQYMSKNDFLEVETPTLNAIASGAFAGRFKTHHSWTAHPLYLRIATELPLKKLLVGGLERVYEIGKVFRNEPVDKSHSAEFTTLEAYQAFGSYHDMMSLTENLVAHAALAVNRTTMIASPTAPDTKVDLSPPWPRLSLLEQVEKLSGIDLHKERELPQLKEAALKLKQDGKFANSGAINITPDMTWGRLVDHLLSIFVEPTLVKPSFLIDYPVETTPLAKRTSNPNIVERAEGFIFGMEITNIFTELNDPIEQRQRMETLEELNREFRKQKATASDDTDEEDRLDPDFLRAMEYGMPISGGTGIGIDRLVMLLTNKTNIGDVILFPSLYDAA